MTRNAFLLRKLRELAVAAGKCQQCRTRKAKKGRITCQTCLTAGYERRRAYFAIGLCTCGKPPSPGHSSCAKHLEKNNRNHWKSLQRKAENGICLRCTKKPLLGSTVCRKHLKERSAAMAKHLRKRSARGQCRSCKWPKLDHSVYCAKHLEYHRKKSAESAAKRYHEARRSGTCTACRHRKAVAGIRLCHICRPLVNAYERAVYAKRRAKVVRMISR